MNHPLMQSTNRPPLDTDAVADASSEPSAHASAPNSASHLRTVSPISQRPAELSAPRLAAEAPAPAADRGDAFSIDDAKEGIRSFLAEGEIIEGSIHLKSGIRVAGRITGEIRSESGAVVIEPGARVGRVMANGPVLVAGFVGDSESGGEPSDQLAVHTPDTLSVAGSGVVCGSFEYGRLATYDDATLEGFGRKLKRG